MTARWLLGAGGRQARRERAALATLLEYRVDGVILVSPRMRAADIAAAASEVPVVMVGRQIRSGDAAAPEACSATAARLRLRLSGLARGAGSPES